MRNCCTILLNICCAYSFTGDTLSVICGFVFTAMREAGRQRIKPDILWLSADTHNLELTVEIRRTSPETNVIFVADDTDNAYDAIRVHASGYIIRPLTEGNVRAELDDQRQPVSHDCRVGR